MKAPTIFQALLRRVGFHAGPVDYKSERSHELERLLKDEEVRTAEAIKAFNQTSSDLQIQGIETAQHLTEARRAVIGVTRRLAPVHVEDDMLSDGRRSSALTGAAKNDVD